jgi:preprotein translocase subunit SecE
MKSKLLWLLVILIVIGGITANTYYGDTAWAIRAGIGIVLTVAILGLAGLTPQGQAAWAFVKGSRAELRKVVWPSRQETVQTTLVVVAMIVVTALILWAFDALFLWLIGFITGQRGL